MKIATNRFIIDKATSAVLAANNGTFVNIDLTAVQLAQRIQSGHAFCAQHKDMWRKQTNFIAAGFLAVDIDHGLSVQNALDDDFVQRYACILYTTASHTEDFPRFRIVFELEVAITDPVKMKNAFTGLIQRFGGDAACKDSCHMFYGSTASTPVIIGKILPDQQVDELVTRVNETRLAVSSMACDQKRTSTRSIVVLPVDTEVKVESGVSYKLADVPPDTRIFCPRHSDSKASAFTLRSTRGNPGLYCSKCITTYFLDNGNGGSGRDENLYDFDYSWKKILKLTMDEYEENLTDEGQLPLNVIRGGTIRAVSNRYLPYIRPELADGSDEDLLGCHKKGSAITPYRVNFIKSPKGSGKTKWLELLVEDCKSENMSILLIGHRRSLISASAKRLGLTCYLCESSDSEELSSKTMYNPATKHYAICVDSLMTRLDTAVHRYDLILIDESEQVFSHLLAETMKKNRREILHTMKHFLNKSKAVYLLDADLGRTTIEIIDAMLDDAGDYQAIVNKWTPPNNTVHLYKGKNHLIGELFASLRRGERCFVCANSKKRIIELHSEIGQQFGDAKRLLMVTSENAQNPEIQKIIQNIKTCALEYDAIFVSPALGTGIDITFDDDSQLIDSVFGIFEARVNTHFDIDQQLARVRNPKKTYVYISSEQFSFESDSNAIRAELVASTADHSVFLGINPDGTKKYLRDDLYETIFGSVTAMQRASKNQLLKNFRELKAANGWTVVDVENDADIACEGKKAADAGKERINKLADDGILGAKQIDSDLYEAYKRKNDAGHITPDEQFAMRRYELESFYRENVTPELLKMHDAGKFRECVRMYETLYLSADDLRNKEWFEDRKLADDRRIQSQQQKLFVSLFSAAGILGADRKFDASKEIQKPDLDGFSNECLRSKLEIERLLDIPVRKNVSTNPTQQLSALLKIIGLSLKKTSTKSAGGDKLYIYTLDAEKLALIQRTVDRRADKGLSDAWTSKRRDSEVNLLWRTGHGKVEFVNTANDPVTSVA